MSLTIVYFYGVAGVLTFQFLCFYVCVCVSGFFKIVGGDNVFYLYGSPIFLNKFF